MTAPAYTPAEGPGAVVTDPGSGQAYVFTESGWSPVPTPGDPGFVGPIQQPSFTENLQAGIELIQAQAKRLWEPGYSPAQSQIPPYELQRAQIEASTPALVEQLREVPSQLASPMEPPYQPQEPTLTPEMEQVFQTRLQRAEIGAVTVPVGVEIAPPGVQGIPLGLQAEDFAKGKEDVIFGPGEVLSRRAQVAEDILNPRASLQRDLEATEKSFIAQRDGENVWLGSQADYESYQRKVERYNELLKEEEDLGFMEASKRGLQLTGVKAAQTFPTTTAGALGAVSTLGLAGGIATAGAAVVPAIARPVVTGLRVLETGAETYFSGAPTEILKREGLISPETESFGLFTPRTAGLDVQFQQRFLGGISTGLPVTRAVGRLTGGARTLFLGPSKIEGLSGAGRSVGRRASVIVESNGEVLLGKSKESGTYMSIGGGIDKGETVRQAAIREAAEELFSIKTKGLTTKEISTKLKSKGFDVSKLKKGETLSLADETQYVYRINVDKAKLKLKPGSDISGGVDWFKKETFKGYTGPSKWQPESVRATVGGKRVRTDEALILARADSFETVQKKIRGFSKAERKKQLAAAKKWGRGVVGTGKLEGTGAVSDDVLLKDYLMSKEGYKVTRLFSDPAEAFMRKGAPVFVKERTPGGQFRKFQDMPPTLYGRGSRYRVLGETARKFATDKLVPLVSASPGKLDLKTRGALDRALKSLGVKQKELEVVKSRLKRGKEGLYFQPPTTPEGLERYAGVSYLGLGQPSRYTLGFKKPSPRLLLAKEQISASPFGIPLTKKALGGTELEVAAAPPASFKISRRGERGIGLAGVGIKRQKLELVKPGERGKTLAELTPSYTPGVGVYAPSPAPLFAGSPGREPEITRITTDRIELGAGPSQYRAPTRTYVSVPPVYRAPTASYVPRTPSYLPRITGYAPTASLYRPQKAPYRALTPGYAPVTPPYRPRTPGYPPRTPGYRPTPPPFTPYTSKGYKSPFEEEKKRRAKKGAPAFAAFVRRRGKFFRVSRATTKGRALRIGAKRARETLAASFKIKRVKGRVAQTDIAFTPSRRVFRKPKKRGVEQLESPIFVQRGGAEPAFVPGRRLASPGERAEFVKSRRQIKFI